MLCISHCTLKLSALKKLNKANSLPKTKIYYKNYVKVEYVTFKSKCKVKVNTTVSRRINKVHSIVIQSQKEYPLNHSCSKLKKKKKTIMQKKGEKKLLQYCVLKNIKKKQLIFI